MMTNDEYAQYWIDSAQENYDSMLRIFDLGEYPWAIYLGHLLIVKLLKAHLARSLGAHVPWMHDLLGLANQGGLTLTPEQRQILDRLTFLQARLRYPSVHQKHYGRIDKGTAEYYLRGIKEIRQWLLSILSK